MRISLRAPATGQTFGERILRTRIFKGRISVEHNSVALISAEPIFVGPSSAWHIAVGPILVEQISVQHTSEAPFSFRRTFAGQTLVGLTWEVRSS